MNNNIFSTPKIEIIRKDLKKAETIFKYLPKTITRKDLEPYLKKVFGEFEWKKSPKLSWGTWDEDSEADASLWASFEIKLKDFSDEMAILNTFSKSYQEVFGENSNFTTYTENTRCVIFIETIKLGNT